MWYFLLHLMMYAQSNRNLRFWRSSTFRKVVPITKKVVKIEPCELVNDYTSQSAIHGLRYISNVKANILEKIFWMMALVSCSVAACLVAGKLWYRYDTIPTVIAVKDTHLPLYLFPFPSITVCPAIKVKKSLATEYFLRYVDSSNFNESMEKNFLHMMSALSLMQHPTYHRMKIHVNVTERLQMLLKDINVTDFMLSVLPKCDEIFGICKWHGELVDCCEVFSLQRTEEGFCYSFNSLTAESGKHCPLSEVLENLGVVEEDDIMYEGCQLRRNTAVGTQTGLEVYLNKQNESESLGYNQKDLNGARAIVHTSYEYPTAGDGFSMREEENIRISIMTYPFITVTSDTVKEIDIRSRACVFPDEMKLHIYHVYTESSCLTECRLNFIRNKCNCNMYYFIPPASLRLYSPPIGTPGFDEATIKRSLNCSHCLPTCYETEYDVEIDIISETRKSSNLYFGHLDVTYGNLGATKYQRDITFTWIDLLVSLGGIANLFLGFSLLSVIEFIYWSLKILLALVWQKYKQIMNRHRIIKVKP